MIKNEEIYDVRKNLNDMNIKGKRKKGKKITCANCGKIIDMSNLERKPETCIYCNNEFWDKPDYEFRLFTLQKQYLQTRNNELLAEMYTILKLYAKKTIVKTIKNSFYFKKDELEMKAHDSANKIIMYYLEKPEFKIDGSFGGYLAWPVLNVLYGDKKKSFDSLNSLVDGESSEFSDCVSNFSSELREKMIVEFTPEVENEISHSSEVIMGLIELMLDKIKNNSIKEYLLTLVAVEHRIKCRSDSFMDSFYLYAGLNIKTNIDKIFSEIRKKLLQLNNLSVK